MSGLRERKKRATKEALSWAALKLAVERGMENVLVEEIAAEAGVSPRTFNNYFSSKYEAIVWRELDRMTRVGDVLRERPPDEPFWDAITHAVLAVYGTTPPEGWTSGVKDMVSSPLLIGELLKVNAAMERALAEAIAERIGVDVEQDMFPRIVAGAVGSACSVAQDQWLTVDPPVPLTTLIRTALGQLTRLQGGEP